MLLKLIVIAIVAIVAPLAVIACVVLMAWLATWPVPRLAVLSGLVLLLVGGVGLWLGG